MEHGIEKNKTNMGMPIFVYKIKKCCQFDFSL